LGLLPRASSRLGGIGPISALYDPTDKSVFVLPGDDAMMVKMAATEVTVKGTMDKGKKMITVTSMEAMPAK
jgi:hypothetical protein